MKEFINNVVLLLLYAIFGRKKQKGLLILTYHRVTELPDYNDPLKVSKNIFEKQIQYLKSNYNIISGQQLFDAINEKRKLPDNSCLITFDDGWKDNYTNAYPILKKYKVPAMIFICTGFVGTEKIFWHEQLQEILKAIPENTTSKKIFDLLKEWPSVISKHIFNVIETSIANRQTKINELISLLKIYEPNKINNLNNILAEHFDIKDKYMPLMLSWDDVIDMSKSNITFGSHTQNHLILTQITKSQIVKELKESKEIIEKKIGQKVYFLSYPNGNYDERIIKIADQHGYMAGFTCNAGVNVSLDDNLELKRKHILEKRSLGFNKKFSKVLFKIDITDIRKFVQY